MQSFDFSPSIFQKLRNHPTASHRSLHQPPSPSTAHLQSPRTDPLRRPPNPCTAPLNPSSPPSSPSATTRPCTSLRPHQRSSATDGNLLPDQLYKATTSTRRFTTSSTTNFSTRKCTRRNLRTDHHQVGTFWPEETNCSPEAIWDCNCPASNRDHRSAAADREVRNFTARWNCPRETALR